MRDASSDPGVAYERVARAIRYLDEHCASRPALAAVAAHVGLSEAHFQRLFRDWAGVSPKQYLQFLTRERARQCLREMPVLEAAHAAGLSGAGRLHDLMLRWDAATPGDYRDGGARLMIRYGEIASPFGRCFLATTTRGICHLAFVDDDEGFCTQEALLATEWPAAARLRDDAAVATLAPQVFPRDGLRREPLRLFLHGSAFQLKVWEALLAIPDGGLYTYQAVATAIGSPAATRAVASAIARNHIGWLIPCHRVIRASGEFSQYRWGATRKQAMIAWEASRRDGGAR